MPAPRPKYNPDWKKGIRPKAPAPVSVVVALTIAPEGRGEYPDGRTAELAFRSPMTGELFVVADPSSSRNGRPVTVADLPGLKAQGYTHVKMRYHPDKTHLIDC